MSPLPRLLVLTDRSQCRAGSLVEVVGEAVRGGARAVVLREKDLPPEERLRLAEEVAALVRPAGALLLVASDRRLAAAVGADGVHLAASDLWSPTEDPDLLVGRSCHSVEELHRAAQTGADYATLSPFWGSPSKPGYGPALGAHGLGQVLRQARHAPPVYALGGVTPERVGECLRAGAHGVAVMGAVMRAGDPGRVVEDLLRELPSASPAEEPGWSRAERERWAPSREERS